MKAIRFDEVGGPEVLKLQDIALPSPGPGEALVRHTAIGVNFIDTYFRKGVYKTRLPSGLGSEAAGVVEAVGPDVTLVRPGDRVAYAMGPLGAYAEMALRPASGLVKIPATLSDDDAAALLLKGMTAEYLLFRTYAVKPGQTILVFAAAGGVGLLLCQWAKALGVRVIGVVGSEAKVAVARSNGCAEVVVMQAGVNIPERVKALTGGRGVPVVYDSVGKDTFQISLDCLEPRGLLASFGNSSGPITGVDLGQLSKGSYYVTRPGLAIYTGTRPELEASAAAVFKAAAEGTLKISINQRYPLSEAATAHRDLEGRKTTGASLLIP